MNTTYLLSLFIVALVSVGAIISAIKVKGDANILLVALSIWGGIATGAMLMVSFFNALGHPTIVKSSDFLVELTPYRVVVTGLDLEITLKDAYSVANADRIIAVEKTIKRNAWGIEVVGATLKPIFRDPNK